MVVERLEWDSNLLRKRSGTKGLRETNFLASIWDGSSIFEGSKARTLVGLNSDRKQSLSGCSYWLITLALLF